MNFPTFFGLFNQTKYAGNQFYALALYAQAQLETGHFKDHKFTQKNNGYGMRPSKSRTKYYDEVYTGSNGSFAVYPTFQMSLIDRIDLDEYNGVNVPTNATEVGDYMVQVIAKGYTPDAGYIPAWFDLYKKSATSNLGITSAEQLQELAESAPISIKKVGLISLPILALIAFIYFKFIRKN